MAVSDKQCKQCKVRVRLADFRTKADKPLWFCKEHSYLNENQVEQFGEAK